MSSCYCDLKLTLATLGAANQTPPTHKAYQKKYHMPCEQAVQLLKRLDGKLPEILSTESVKAPLYTVRYSIKTNDAEYKSQHGETLLNAADKIESFMKGPEHPPKSDA